MAGMEAEGTMRGEYWVPNKHHMYSAQVLTQDLYPQVINTHARSRRRRADHAAVLGRGLRRSGAGKDHRPDAALREDGRPRTRSNSSRPRGTRSARSSARATRSTKCSMRARASSRPATATAPLTGPGANGMVDSLMSALRSRRRTGRANRTNGNATMKVAIVNLGQIVSGDWRNPFAAGDTIVTDGERIVVGRHRVGAGGRGRRRGDRCRRHDGDPRPDRLARAHHVRRLHAAPAHRRLSRKLSAWRHHDGDLGVRGACAGPAERPRGRQGAGGRRAALLCRLSARRHEGDRRLGDPGAGPQGSRLRGTRAEGRAAGQGRLRRGEDRLRLCAAGRRRQGRGPHHHLPHRRLVDPGLRRDHRRSSARRCIRMCRSTSTAGRPRCRTRTSSASSANPRWRCRSAPPATCAPRCSARGSPSSTARSTASSSRPTRRPAAASCRSACSTPSRISRA